MGRGTRWQGQCGVSLQQYVFRFLKDLPMIELWMQCHSSYSWEWFKSNPTPLKFFMLNFLVMFFMGIDHIFQGNILMGDERRFPVSSQMFFQIFLFQKLSGWKRWRSHTSIALRVWSFFFFFITFIQYHIWLGTDISTWTPMQWTTVSWRQL